MDRPVVPAKPSDFFNIGLLYCRRCEGELFGISQHPQLKRREPGTFKIGSQMTDSGFNFFLAPALGLQQSFQTTGMVDNSVVAPVEARDQYRDHLPLYRGPVRLAVHQLQVKLMMQFHDPRMYRMNLDNVVIIIYPFLFRNLVPGNPFDKCHELIFLIG